ncbi:MAG: translation elongation factor Ts [Bacteroides sp.]|nr:translation elongation factor Ts [Prevotella sp.]MCM1408225.1 translation elongation factor Ts [Treponema brennaborense]MCM1469549.1 translation elongation factor Ts [Bacteroides sp.]
MDIKASEVKALRDKTGAGMMECKKALVECSGDAEAAAKLLKEKGLAAVEKRAGRTTSEGRIFIAAENKKAAICELTCETDFVAKNADFIAIGEKITRTALEKNITEVTKELSDMLLDLATKIRENMTVRRLQIVEIPDGALFAKYIHSDGKTGVITVITADSASALENEKLKEFAYDCCLHIAAFTPAYITRADVDEKYIAEQKEIFTAQVADLNKPENVKAGIIQGKLNKHLAEICFMDQPFVKDDKVSVSEKMKQLGKEMGTALALNKVVLYQLGA